MLTIRNETPGDVFAREALLDRVWGPSRLQKTAERLREGRAPARRLSFVASENGSLLGTLRLWHVCAGPARPALLLGPLAVEATRRGRGIGSALMLRATAAARRLGHRAVLLIGDQAYYEQFGFSAEKTRGLWLPGPYKRHRLLACELVPGALDGAHGLIAATGGAVPKPALDARIADLSRIGTTARRAA